MVEVGDRIPMRWIPPETIKKRRWSEKSDVWAFGVLMIVGNVVDGRCSLCICDQCTSDEEVAKQVTARERLDQPNRCPDDVYEVMQQCWQC